MLLPVVGVPPKSAVMGEAFDKEAGQSRSGSEHVAALGAAGISDDSEDAGIDRWAETIAHQWSYVVHGLLLPGGCDVDPNRFGEEPHLANGRIDPVADAFELALARCFLQLNRPILGICRGAQVLNIAAGGDIYQDVYEQTKTQLQHVQRAPAHYATHKVEIRAGSLLEKVFGKGPARVNSFHHQAVRRLAPGFCASATSSDGLVEAIERTSGGFALGVQWHPERRYHVSARERALFIALIDACRHI